MAKAVFEQGGKVNAADKDRITLLQIAAQHRYENVFAALVDSGVYIFMFSQDAHPR